MVREIHYRFGQESSIIYTGDPKLLQNMFATGLVRRDQGTRVHVYKAREPNKTERLLQRELMGRVFGGSESQLVLHLPGDQQASPEKIEQIQRMLAAHRRRSK